eukprot:6522951-Karenia_brevis.AAC.1
MCYRCNQPTALRPPRQGDVIPACHEVTATDTELVDVSSAPHPCEPLQGRHQPHPEEPDAASAIIRLPSDFRAR